jgi:23S rRNA (cytidine1920-2'-O)/16S rRNA (cytidine1409-2'-O)-methyltransferase
VPRKGRARLRALSTRVREAYPELDPETVIRDGRVLVGGRVITNPASLVRGDATLALRANDALRGEAKLESALAAFAVDVRGKVALDLGAAAGGFTRVLLGAGAARVYAVDAGHGQLLGSLRQSPRVVNLERTNLADLTTALVPEPVAVVTADLSYVALARALPQLRGRIRLRADAVLVALVKPMFELGLREPPTEPSQLAEACARAAAGASDAGWQVQSVIESPVRGRHGSIEFFLQAATRRGRS